MEKLFGYSWASEPPSVPEGLFSKGSWVAFASRCNAANLDRERIQCICCNKVVKCPSADPYALYLHVGSKIGIGHHPTASTYQRWKREWGSTNPTASSSIDPEPSQPPPWVLEAEENRLDAVRRDEARDAHSRPVASRKQSASWYGGTGCRGGRRKRSKRSMRLTQDSNGRNLCWSFQSGDCNKTGSSQECTDRPSLGHACEWCGGNHPGYKCSKKPHGSRNGGLSKVRGKCNRIRRGLQGNLRGS